MLKRFLLFSLFSLSIMPCLAFGQTLNAPAKSQEKNEIIAKFPNLKKQSDEMVKAFSTKDFDKFADFMYPKLVEMVGGKEKFVSVTSSAIKDAEALGVKLSNYVIENPTQEIENDKQIFSVLPTTTILKTPNGTISQQRSLLAISEDDGNSWKFISVQSKDSLKIFFPNIVDKLIIPEPSIRQLP